MSWNWGSALTAVRLALMRRGKSAYEAEDLSQEAWIRLHEYQTTRVVSNPDALLMHSALNLSVNEHWRQAKRGVSVSLEDAVLIDPAPAADAVLLSKERMQRLEGGLVLLSARARQLFLEHHIEGKSHAQIAREQGISVTAVQRHLAKATLKLAGWMEGW